jgi:hypothetical protein
MITKEELLSTFESLTSKKRYIGDTIHYHEITLTKDCSNCIRGQVFTRVKGFWRDNFGLCKEEKYKREDCSKCRGTGEVSVDKLTRNILKNIAHSTEQHIKYDTICKQLEDVEQQLRKLDEATPKGENK